MRSVPIPVTTTGANGSASGSANTYITGARLAGLKVDYAAGQPATTDVTVTLDGIAIVTLTDQATDRLVHPRVAAQTAAGADIAGSAVEPVLAGRLNVAVAGANAAAPAVIVTLILE